MKSPSSGLDNFPALDEPMGSSQVRVTGNVGLGEDEELDKFESAFPDLSSEMPEAVSSGTRKGRGRQPKQCLRGSWFCRHELPSHDPRL